MGKRTNTAKWNGHMWRIDVQKDGTRHSFYSSKPGRTGQREANSKADAWLDQGICPGGIRVETAATEWLENLKKKTGRSNWRPIDGHLRNYVLPRIGRRKVADLTEQHLQDIIDSAYAAGLARKTLQNLCSELRSFCKYCRRAKYTTLTPEELTIPAGARPKGKTVLQPIDLQKLLQCDSVPYRGKLRRDPYINAYRFQVMTGLRPGELIGLRWEDISGRTVRVQRSINVYHEETKGKNDNAVRSFQMSDLAAAILDDQRQYTEGESSVFDINSTCTYYKHWKLFCESNGITPCSPYELRHTFVSVVKTLPPGMVKPLVGHSADMDTFGVYGHALNGDDQRAAVAVNGAFVQLLASFKQNA